MGDWAVLVVFMRKLLAEADTGRSGFSCANPVPTRTKMEGKPQIHQGDENTKSIVKKVSCLRKYLERYSRFES
jgi:hypothetical protein